MSDRDVRDRLRGAFNAWQMPEAAHDRVLTTVRDSWRAPKATSTTAPPPARRRLALVIIAVIGFVILGGGAVAVAARLFYVNPGHFAGPAQPRQETGPRPTLAQALAKAHIPGNVLLRPSASDPKRAMTPADVEVDPAGFKRPQLTLTYSDGLYLMIRTLPQPFDPQEWISLDDTATPNSLGQTHLYRPFTVRGTPGAVRDPGEKLFSGGEAAKYPASLIWGDPTEKAPPYTVYFLNGDRPVSVLDSVASSMVPLSDLTVGK